MALFLLRHLGMDNPSACCHPLHIAVFQFSHIAHVILMLHMPVEHIGHRLKTAVWMRRESTDIVAGVLRTELVQHQEGVEAAQLSTAEYSFQTHAVTIGACSGNK